MLSIGYAACHWCHVMSRESFDDKGVADFINEHFIAIKVDREQHPLVDDTYMMATQALTGAGGWPMTVFTLPDGRAFHAGTYYPPAPRGRVPSFTQVLSAVHEAYNERRDSVEQQAAALAGHLAELGSGHHRMLGVVGDGAGGKATTGLHDAIASWIESTRPAGGFGPAPKFPPTQSLIVIWQQLLTSPAPQELFDAASTTTEALLLGGLQDHVSGGFARYCVDEQWQVPHFEKMLYDNAQLLRMLAICRAVCTVLSGEFSDLQRQQRAANLARASERAVRGIMRWMGHTMLTQGADGVGGALAASLDADSLRNGQGVEGAYYTFGRQQVRQLLSQLPQPLPEGLIRWGEVSEDPGYFCLSLARMPQPEEWEAWDQLLGLARELRSERSVPQRDDKVIAGWNGLAIEALCVAADILEEPGYRDLAVQVAETLWEQQVDRITGRLARTGFGAVADHHNEGTLEDYAALALGFGAVAAGEPHGIWGQRSRLLLDRALDFVDERGLARDTVELDQVLSAQRGQQPAATVLDDAIPSAASLLARALCAHAVAQMAAGIQGEELHRQLERASALVTHTGLVAGKFPSAVAGALEVQAVLDRPAQYLRSSGGTARELARWRTVAAVLGMGLAPAAGELPAGPDGSLRVYPCRFTSCQAPVAEPGQLLGVLRLA